MDPKSDVAQVGITLDSDKAHGGVNLNSRKRRRRKKGKRQKSDIAQVGITLDSDKAHGGVNLNSRKRRRRKKGKRQKSTPGDDTKLVQNINQVNQGIIVEVDSTVKLNAEHQGSVKVSTIHPSEKTVESGGKARSRRRKVKKKAQAANGSLGIDHAVIMSNLKLVDGSDGFRHDKSTKSMVTQDSGFLLRKESFIRTSQLLNGVDGHPKITSPVIFQRRKLLVLDINGLIADIVMPAPRDCKADKIARRAIFKRPFYRDFLMFCCERFDVGIWSSRSEKIIDKVVDYLLGDLKHKLLFCWNVLHCTETRFKTLENKHKPLVFKELRKLWEKHYPDLPWENGYYNESNTVLLDDSPYKALLNPIHTAIFPRSYHYGDKNDNSLGPEGDIRVYLEGLAASDNTQKYIEQHPFGQGAIDERSPRWAFYSTVLHRCSVQDTKGR